MGPSEAALAPPIYVDEDCHTLADVVPCSSEPTGS